MRIVYATDGSAGARVVGEVLGRLPLTPEDEILLFGVLPLAEGDPERLFAPARATLDGTSARVEAVTGSGSPAEQILQFAGERGADLVAVGATGLTGLARFFIGSVAERVLRHAECPVLVGRRNRHGLQKALVGVDTSVMAARVADTAARFPLPEETEIRLVTVLPPEEAVMGAAPLVWASLSQELESIMKTAQEEAEDRLRGLAEVFQEPGKKVAAELLRGDPSTALINAAEKEGADLVFLGSTGEGGMDRFLLGSVSERVARHAPCSVLVVR